VVVLVQLLLCLPGCTTLPAARLVFYALATIADCVDSLKKCSNSRFVISVSLGEGGSGLGNHCAETENMHTAINK
jgi:hypothetical protein